MTTIVYSKSEVDALLAAIPTGGRARLAAWMNLYVDASAGLDTNDGLTWATAWQTPTRAYQFVRDNIDLDGNGILCNSRGNFTGMYSFLGPLVGDRGGCFNIMGNTADKTAAFFNSPNAISMYLDYGANVTVQWITICGTTAPLTNIGVSIGGRSRFNIYNTRFGATADRCIEVAGSTLVQFDEIEISGDSPYFIVGESTSNVSITKKFTTIGGSRHFSVAFLDSNAYSTCEASGISKNETAGAFTGIQATLWGGHLNTDSLSALPGNLPVTSDNHNPASLYYVGGVRQTL
jgi:hypothetical protein